MSRVQTWKVRKIEDNVKSKYSLDAMISPHSQTVMYYSRAKSEDRNTGMKISKLKPNTVVQLTPQYLPELDHTGIQLSTIGKKYHYPYLYKSSAEVIGRRTAIRASLRDPYSEQIKLYLNCEPVLSPLTKRFQSLDKIRKENELQIFRVLDAARDQRFKPVLEKIEA